MFRILFVCHGNICRSPMAEFVMKKLVNDAGLTDKFHISSCATSTEEIYNGMGNPIYPPAQREMKSRGIPFDSKKRAVQLNRSDYDKYDYIIAMDSMNVRNIMRIIGDDKNNKVSKLLDYTDRKGDVADPWYTGGFDAAFEDIYRGCSALLKKLSMHEH